MKRRAIPVPDYDDPKELYAFFGLTFYNAQVLEQGVVNLAVALNAKGTSNVTAGDVLGLYDELDRDTFGKVLREARSLTTFPDGLEGDLQKALDYRNYLAHRFFVEHSEAAVTASGRKQMIDELRSILEFLVRVDTEFDPIWMSAWNALGVTKERFNRKFEEIKAAARRVQGNAQT